MTFLDEVDSLRARAGISARISVALGLAVAAVVVCVGIGMMAFGVFMTPPVEVSTSENDAAAQEAEESVATVFVHVAGAVVSPGLYELSEGARIADAIEAAGGLSEGASAESINLAREVADGEQIFVGSQASAADVSGSGEIESQTSSGMRNGKVNLNRASAKELMSLDGVGEATANKIIAYREEQGSFATIDDLKNVSGIGDKKFEALRDKICV